MTDYTLPIPHPNTTFGRNPIALGEYLAVEMVKIVNRSARLRAMDRAMLARDEVRWRRRALGTSPYLFSEYMRPFEEELAGWVMEWREAIEAMKQAKRGM